MTIDFQRQNSLSEKIELVRALYERFNLNHGNLIDMNMVDEAISNIVVANDKLNNIPEIVRTDFNRTMIACYFEGKIYVKGNFAIETLFHEILHYITKETGGIKYPLVEMYSDEEFKYYINKYGQARFYRQIEQFDEALTYFITSLAIPEVKVEDAYQYGANVIKRYYDGLISKGKDPSFVLEMYIYGDSDKVRRFKDSFGGKFDGVIQAIERINNVRFYIMKPPKDPNMSWEEVNAAIDNAVDNVKVL